MDGQFVPNLTVGPDVIAAARDRVALPFKAHLMTLEPGTWCDRKASAGSEPIIVHAEACVHLHRRGEACSDLMDLLLVMTGQSLLRRPAVHRRDGIEDRRRPAAHRPGRRGNRTGSGWGIGPVQRKLAHQRTACWAQSTRRSEGRSMEPK